MLIESVTGPGGLLSPDRCLAYELLQMAAPLSFSNHHLIALASILPESQVGSVVSAYRSALSSFPLSYVSQTELSLLLTTILQDENSLFMLQALDNSFMPGSLTTPRALSTGKIPGT